MYSAFEKLTVGSEGDLLNLRTDLIAARGPTSSKGAIGAVMRTLGKLNHTYESCESLTSHTSSASLTNADSEMNLCGLSVFSVMEHLTLNFATSRGNLLIGEGACLLSSPMSSSSKTTVGTFFAALQEYLSIYANEQEEGEEDSFASEAETLFPKLC